MQAQTSRSRAATLPLALTLLAMIFATQSEAQWDIQDSHTTASLRGIASVDTAIAWASGTGGTILHTTDGGANWQRCATPPGAENLDFRGIQAFDADTAIVMSSGKGDLSRLYKTTDACQTWKLLFTNPDKEGFWDAIVLNSGTTPKASLGGVLIGDPVQGRFPVWRISREQGPKEGARTHHGPRAHQDEAAFAASNSAIFAGIDGYSIGTGGIGGARVIREVTRGVYDLHTWTAYRSTPVPIGTRTASSGIFSLSFAATPNPLPHEWELRISNSGVAVGGDYQRPADDHAIAAFTHDGGLHWLASQSQPHGYRSAVAYDTHQKLWITVGPNGTDISTDDGRNWTPLKPSNQDPPDADKNWNALSLPYVVGPNGRIGKLRPINLTDHLK